MRDLLPPAGDLPGLDDAGLAPFVRQVRREATAPVQATLFAGALLYVLSPVFTVFVPLPSFLLPRALRDRHAERLVGTRLYFVRQLVFLLKMYACMCWGQDAGVRARFGLSPYAGDSGGFRAS